MKRILPFALFALASSPSLPAHGTLGTATVSEIAGAITELDVVRARELLSKVGSDSNALALERARLSLYLGDCDTAGATLASLSGVKEAAPLSEVARTCAHATAGSSIIEDAHRGLWIRLQDDEDRVLVPLLSDVAERARASIERDLGVILPRPLRIDLVRDLFSLSSVSGLPLEAAETTGTVAVARWGRVTMISPRAAAHGFPWEDTLAHEITHLAVTRATRDEAPLWLQEGLAKREEIRWRPRHPFDGEPSPDAIARDALLSGESVGVDKLGPSIAMLPSADAATIAFAEVSSFVGYFVEQTRLPALRLLFADLKQLGSSRASEALSSVSGYDLPGWISRWQAELLHDAPVAPKPGEPVHPKAALPSKQGVDARELSRQRRLGALLFARGASSLSADRLKAALRARPGDPAVVFEAGRSLIASGESGVATPLFSSPEGLSAPHAGWFALSGRLAREARTQEDPQSRAALDLALALDPYLEEAACEGQFAIPDGTGNPGPITLPEKTAAPQRALCESARKIPRE